MGASFLDDRLALGLVPKTRLVGFVSPSFHYLYKDRKPWEQGLQPLPIKIGSLQQFLDGYENASQFFHRYTLPGRPKDIMERDLREEHKAHWLSRRKQGARLRMVFIAIKRLLLCRYGPGPYGSSNANEEATGSLRHTHEATAYPAAHMPSTKTFDWTEETLTDLRLELEKLVVLDFLMRNTDRGLDNFMIRYNPQPAPGERRITIGAIDNSLSFPHQHPQGLRDYPYGWLFLPAGLIGQPFSDETRRLFLPKLCDPVWWAGTIEGLRRIFSQDAHFHERTFQHQVSLLLGQGWLIVQCLRERNEGPIELCARPKCLIHSSVQMMTRKELDAHTVTDLVQGSIAFPSDKSHEHEDTNGQFTGTRAIEVNPRKHDSKPSRLVQSLPTTMMSSSNPLLSGTSHDSRAIDIVERMAKTQKRGLHSPKPYESPRELPSTKASHRMRPLDLDISASVSTYPVPVLVETLEPFTRKAWPSLN